MCTCHPQFMYDTWLHWLFETLVGGLSIAAMYKCIRVGVAPSLTTKGLVVMCELPAVAYLLWTSLHGPFFFTTWRSPTSFLVGGGAGLIYFGLSSKVSGASDEGSERWRDRSCLRAGSAKQGRVCAERTRFANTLIHTPRATRGYSAPPPSAF